MKPTRDPLDPLGLCDPSNPRTLRAIAENDQLGAAIRDQRRGDHRRQWASRLAVVLAFGWFSILWSFWEWQGRPSRTGIRPSGSTQYAFSAGDG